MERRENITQISVNSEILCTVQHVLEDLIVVTFISPNNKPFQGVLLDSTKRNIPFGVNPLGGFNKQLQEDNPRDFDSECSRRHTYYLEDKVSRPPILLPSGKNGKSFLSQDRLGVRLRARQVLCSKCSGVCNEKGQNVRDQSSQQPRTAGVQRKVQRRSLRIISPKAVSKVRSLAETSSPSSSGSVRTRARVRYFGAKKRKGKKKATDSSVTNCDIKPPGELNTISLKTRKTRSIPDEIVDLDDKSKRLAKRNSLVPKLKRLAPSEIERYSDVSNSDRESCSDSEKTFSNIPKVSSSTNSVEPSSVEASMQPLKIKFSNLNKQNSTSRQYSIVQSEDTNVDSNKRNCDQSELQPLKRVKKESGEKEKAGPVLKISFGKESHVMTVSGRERSAGNAADEVDLDSAKQSEDSENVKPSSSREKSGQNLSAAKAAKKALKRAKREAAKRRVVGLVSPGRQYLGAKSPANFSPSQSVSSPASVVGGFSPGSPAYTLMCPGSQKLIIRKVKKKKKKERKEKVDLDETPTTSSPSSSNNVETGEVGNYEENLSDGGEEETGADGGVSVESAMLAGGSTLCVGDVVWGQSESRSGWPGKIVNLMMLHDSTSFTEEVTARAQVSWYTTTTTSLLPLNSLKPFLEIYEEQVTKCKTQEEEEAFSLALKDVRLTIPVPVMLSPSASDLVV